MILLVDEQDTLRYERSRALLEAECLVMEASTLAEAWLMMTSLTPHLLVLGDARSTQALVSFCRKLKEHEDTAHVPLLALCANTAGRVALLSAGADVALAQPVAPAELAATVHGLLRLSKRSLETRRLLERVTGLERQFAEAANCGMWDWDITSGKLDWFGKTERLAGLRPGSFSGKVEAFTDVLHPDDRPRVWRKLEDLMARHETHFEDEHRLVHPDGSIHWVSGIGRFFYDEEGQAVRMTGVVQDITRRKLAEERQQVESERRRLLACAAEQLLVTDNPCTLMAGVFETVRRHLDLDGYFHYRAGDGPSLMLEACAGVPEDRVSEIARLDFGQALCGTAAAKREPLIVEALHVSTEDKAQVVRSLGFHAYACHPLLVGDRLMGTLSFASRTRDRFEPDEIAFMAGICRYVSAAMNRLRLEADVRERAERLRHSEMHLRAARELNPQIPWTAKPDGSLEQVDERWLRLSGLTSEEALDRSWIRVQHEEDLPGMLTAWMQSLRTGEPYQVEHRVRCGSGSYRWMSSRAFPFRDEAGRIVRWYGTTEDIHDRKLAEAALRENRGHLAGELHFRETVMVNLAEGLYTLNDKGLVTYINPAAERLFGWTAEELLGRKMHDVTHYRYPDGTPFPAEACIGLQVLQKGTTVVEQADVFIRKDGTFFDVVYSAAPLSLEGKMTGLVVVFRDVSDKRQAEQALRDSEERFRTIAQAVPSFLFEADARGCNIWSSDGWCRFTGQTQEQVQGHGWAEALHPDDRGANLDRWTQCMQDGVSFESRQRLRRVDGHYAWVMARALPMRNEQGTITRWLGSVTDIDEIVRGEIALRESEERLELAMQAASMGAWEMDLETGRSIWDARVPALLGIQSVSPPTTVASLLEFVHPSDRTRLAGACESAIAAGSPIDLQFRVLHADGGIRWFASRGSLVADELGIPRRVVGIVQDITDRKVAEDALRFERERLKLAVQAGQMGVYDLNLVEDLLWWSPEIYALLGVCAKTFTPTREALLALVHQDDRELFRRSLDRAVADRQLFVHEYRIVRPDGETRWIANRARTEYDPDGRPLRHFGIALDVTERKRIEEEVRRRERHLRVITDSVPSFIAYVDSHERYRFVNAEYEKQFQKPREEILGRSVRDLLGADYPAVQPFIHRVLAGEAVSFERDIRYRGTAHTSLVSFTPDMREGVTAGFYVLITDITERKRHEEQLRRWSEEMEGRVLERTRELVASQDRLRALASQLSVTEQQERRKLARDLHDYLAQLLIVGRLKVSQMKKQLVLPSRVLAAVQDVDQILQQSLGYTRTMIADLSPPSFQEGGLPAAFKWLAERMQQNGLWVEVHSTREQITLPEEKAVFLFQSVRELLFNVLKHAGVSQAVVSVETDDSGQLVVAVEDRGRGMDPAALSGPDQPGHLGLSSVRERMEAMGGRVGVRSDPGQGTRVTLVLPRGPSMMG